MRSVSSTAQIRYSLCVMLCNKLPQECEEGPGYFRDPEKQIFHVIL